jgi:transcription initiation factor IIF auxiliary subunit
MFSAIRSTDFLIGQYCLYFCFQLIQATGSSYANPMPTFRSPFKGLEGAWGYSVWSPEFGHFGDVRKTVHDFVEWNLVGTFEQAEKTITRIPFFIFESSPA